jgi:DNA-binding CsgD family transcriptional regulator
MNSTSSDLSRLILSLYRSAREMLAEQFKTVALELVRAAVAFDSALWATDLGGEPGAFTSVYLLHQPTAMMENYTRFQNGDALASAALHHPGTTFDLYGVHKVREFRRMTVYAEHCQAYGIEQALCTASPQPETGLWTIVSLYRDDPSRPFSEADLRYVQEIYPHLAEACHLNLYLHATGAMDGDASEEPGAVVDRAGYVHTAAPEFIRRALQEWVAWDGRALPRNVLPALLPRGQFRGRRIRLTARPLGDLYRVSARPSVALDGLTDRQRQITVALARGLSYKAIARKFNISPTTVNHHTSAIYERIGVHTRAELAAVIHGDDGVELDRVPQGTAST